ncbi:PTS cellobiose transporter subunit IIC [Lactococcus termiticola]|uniref:Cellobiose-specific PTS system IIB component n=1 Tax=Lactococcus termiticola TaxID=2169526 RepID=A0A2R5HJU4_9LACT|nr:PTS cellobiose transporter subunit IIC [Lactococcus termiticola]GBG96950.1 cellobiose-specific PTS system IIB component [Lactococcus termiticola]
MKTVLIISERGISASNLLFKLAESIHEEDLALDIDYVSFGHIKEKLSKKAYDLLLITPQVSRHQAEMEELMAGPASGLKNLVISDDDFHFMNIPHILRQIKEA